MPYLYAVSIFLSAFLLFQIQPIFGKILLPWFGGTPTVWSTILLFSQVVLTAGYGYAYWLLGKLGNRRQGILHLIILGLSVVILLGTALLWSAPLIPNASWRPQYNDFPILDILRILLVAVGLPFLLLAANSTLMQSWFHRDNPGPTPYRLYAISNTGSLLALITYPFLIEPNLSLTTQAYLWTGTYVVFALLAAYFAYNTLKLKHVQTGMTSKKESFFREKPSKRHYSFWLILAAIATTLLIAVTNQITQEVAVIPFLWVLPLTIYLLTFIFAFSGGYFYSRTIYLVAFFVLTIFSRMLLQVPTDSIVLQLFIYMVLLFICCMICHNELYQLRPHANFLPSFYLMVALGGALGGIFVNLVAPFLFSSGYWELQFGLIACIIVLAIVIHLEPEKPSRKKSTKARQKNEKPWQKLKPVVIVIVVLALFQMAYVVYYISQISASTLATERNFYGVLRIWEKNEEVPELLAHQMTHGQTTHGFQFQPEAIRNLPTTYYSENSGVGLTLLNHPKQQKDLHVGALGLGIGVIASYGQPENTYRFYEINPDVIALAEGSGNYFSFLDDSEANIQMVAGDARVSLEQELESVGSQGFDVLVLDTFSGDAIPLHLLTKEAFEIYLKHLKADGIIAVNISNRYFNLEKPLYRLADEYGLKTALIQAKGDGLQSYDSIWMLLTYNDLFLSLPPIAYNSSPSDSADEDFRLWTDDFSNLFQVLK